MDNSLAYIITQCIANKAVYQQQLYNLLYAEMMKVCLRYTNNMDDAGVLYNSSMLKVFAHIAQFKNVGSFNGWVKRIVINTCIDDCRKINKNTATDYTLENLTTVSVNPEVYENINANAIMDLVSTLPKNTNAVFNMYVLDGYKHHEIATALGITEGTSKWHLNEARRLLKIKLSSL